MRGTIVVVVWLVLVAAATEAQRPLAHWTLFVASWVVAGYGGYLFAGWRVRR